MTVMDLLFLYRDRLWNPSYLDRGEQLSIFKKILEF